MQIFRKIRSILFVIVGLLLVKCSATHIPKSGDCSNFIYQLPVQVEKAIEDSLKQKKYSNACFILSSVNEKFIIVGKQMQKNQKFGFLNFSDSKRVIIVDSKLYPLVFLTDQIFGSELKTAIALEARLRQYDTGNGIKRAETQIDENAFGIKFTRFGEILLLKE